MQVLCAMIKRHRNMDTTIIIISIIIAIMVVPEVALHLVVVLVVAINVAGVYKAPTRKNCVVYWQL